MEYAETMREEEKPVTCLEQIRRVEMVRLQLVREKQFLYGTERISEPELAVEMVKPLFCGADREMMVVLSLSCKLGPLAYEIMAVGGLDCCIVDVRNLFKHAILNNATKIICFHNHPSGEAEPSAEDRQITGRMEEAGRILGISLLDHIIVGDNCYYSMKEHGEMGMEAGKGGDAHADY